MKTEEEAGSAVVGSITDVEFLDAFLTENDSVDNFKGESGEQFSIQFDIPENGKATLRLLKDGEEWVAINCFTWEQLAGLRSICKFGDNHRSRSVTWTMMSAELSSVLDIMGDYK